MCGLVGFSFQDESLLKQAMNCIKHRGPDGEGTYTSNNFSLGHVLLSIRGELNDSIQPYTDDQDEWVMAFNGQIYNTNSIKEKLPLEFVSEELDTKLLFELIKIYRWDFAKYIEGMFSIALFNKKEQKLRLYRDHSGQKPLYFSEFNKEIYFASEIKGLFALGVSKEIYKRAVNFFLHLGYLPGNMTIFKKIKKLMPGEVLTFDLLKKRTQIDKLSKYEGEKKMFNFIDLSDEIFKLTEFHLQSKTPISINLSGGLDSSSLAWAAKKHQSSKISSMTTIFKDAPDSFNEEALLAQKLTDKLKIKHETLEISKNDYLDSLIYSYEVVEEPNGNIGIPIYYLSAKWHKAHNNTVVISGDGGDEVWGGYQHHLESLKFDDRKFSSLRNFFHPQNFLLRKEFFNINNPIDRYIYLRSSVPSYSKKSFSELKKYFKEKFLYLNYDDKFKDLSITEKMLTIERKSWLSEENFLRSDKLYMSFGLEMRSPFALSNFRDEYTAFYKGKNLWKNGFNKHFLRDSMHDKLLTAISRRKRKVGWRPPILESWYDDKFKELFVELFSRNNTDLIDWASIKDLIKKTNDFPGRTIFNYASLAILSDYYGVEI